MGKLTKKVLGKIRVTFFSLLAELLTFTAGVALLSVPFDTLFAVGRQWINDNIKMIASKAGIKTNISFHIARHSFSEACRASNISIYDISKALGHSSIKVTETYLKGFDDLAVDAAMTKVFDY